jgi:CBS domain-containing protein
MISAGALRPNVQKSAGLVKTTLHVLLMMPMRTGVRVFIMLVQDILEDARRRLAVVSRDVAVCDVAEILADANTPLVVVCDNEGIAVGVVSRMDIVKVFSRARGDAFNANAQAIMTTAFHSCRADQALESVWTDLGARRLRCAPVVDESGRPQGVVHARDIARVLLDEVTNEELLLRDYVLGVGYQ